MGSEEFTVHLLVSWKYFGSITCIFFYNQQKYTCMIFFINMINCDKHHNIFKGINSLLLIILIYNINSDCALI